MPLLYDFLPILLFFIVYKLCNIYVATAVAIVISFMQILMFWMKHRYFEKMQLATLIVITVLGSITLILHDPIFIKWKPTIVEWLFAIIFLCSQFIGKKTVIQYIMGNKISLPERVWYRLNMSWVTFFSVMGLLNLYVVYHYSTNAWVNFKLFGTLGLSILFLVSQSLYLSRYLLERQ